MHVKSLSGALRPLLPLLLLATAFSFAHAEPSGPVRVSRPRHLQMSVPSPEFEENPEPLNYFGGDPCYQLLVEGLPSQAGIADGQWTLGTKPGGGRNADVYWYRENSNGGDGSTDYLYHKDGRWVFENSDKPTPVGYVPGAADELRQAAAAKANATVVSGGDAKIPEVSGSFTPQSSSGEDIAPLCGNTCQPTKIYCWTPTVPEVPTQQPVCPTLIVRGWQGGVSSLNGYWDVDANGGSYIAGRPHFVKRGGPAAFTLYFSASGLWYVDVDLNSNFWLAYKYDPATLPPSGTWRQWDETNSQWICHEVVVQCYDGAIEPPCPDCECPTCRTNPPTLPPVVVTTQPATPTTAPVTPTPTPGPEELPPLIKCRIAGAQPTYRTFDGAEIHPKGPCDYSAAEVMRPKNTTDGTIVSTQSFDVTASLRPCHNGEPGGLTLTDANGNVDTYLGCLDRVKIRLTDSDGTAPVDLELQPGLKVAMNGGDVTAALPLQLIHGDVKVSYWTPGNANGGVVVTASGEPVVPPTFVDVTHMAMGMQVRFDGSHVLQVGIVPRDAPPRPDGTIRAPADVKGLCGNFDEQAEDDFTLRDGSLASLDVTTAARLPPTKPEAVDATQQLGNSWLVADSPTPLPDIDCTPTDVRPPCETDEDLASRIADACGQVSQAPQFGPCRQKNNPSDMYDQCVVDACYNCRNGGGSAECTNGLAKVIDAYVKFCALDDIIIPRPPVPKIADNVISTSTSTSTTKQRVDDTDVKITTSTTTPVLTPVGSTTPGPLVPSTMPSSDFVCAAACRVHGDPHYRTFDGLRHHFQGDCSYTLSKPCRAPSGTPTFEIVTSHRPCGIKPGYACVKELLVRLTTQLLNPATGTTVDIKTEVILGQASADSVPKGPAQMTLNGVDVTANLPLSVLGGTLSASFDSPSGLTVLESRPLGFRLEWDGKHWVSLCVDESLSGGLCGLCGNFNGDATDELRPKGDFTNSLPYDPATVQRFAFQQPSVPAVVTEFGASWQVARPDVDPATCHTVKDDTLCSEDGDKYQAAIEACSVMLNAPNFANCRQGLDVAPYFNDCVYDLCAACKDAADVRAAVTASSTELCFAALQQAIDSFVKTCVADTDTKVSTTTPMPGGVTTVTVPVISTATVPIVSTVTVPTISTVTVPTYSTVTVPVISTVTVPIISTMTVPVVSTVTVPVLTVAPSTTIVATTVTVPTYSTVTVPVITPSVTVPTYSTVTVPVVSTVTVPTYSTVTVPVITQPGQTTLPGGVSTVTVPVIPSTVTVPVITPPTTTEPAVEPATTIAETTTTVSTLPGPGTTTIADTTTTTTLVPPPSGVDDKECWSQCTVHGRSHYTTFDSLRHHFQGVCSYTIAESPCLQPATPLSSVDGRAFRVVGSYQQCGADPGVSCLANVTAYIKLPDSPEKLPITVHLTRGDGIYVYGGNVLPFLPFKALDGQLTITRQPTIEVSATTGEPRPAWLTVVAADAIGFNLVWDHRHKLSICLTKSWVGQQPDDPKGICGLCGNNNGAQEDDLRLLSGEVLSVDPAEIEFYDQTNAQSLPVQKFGNSYWVKNPTVPDAPFDAGTCQVEEIPFVCENNPSLFRRVKQACALLRDAPQLARCRDAIEYKPYYQDCIFDTCQNCRTVDRDPAVCNEALRTAIDAYTKVCVDENVFTLHTTTTTTSTASVVTTATTKAGATTTVVTEPTYRTVTVPIIVGGSTTTPPATQPGGLPTTQTVPVFRTETVPVVSTVTVPVISTVTVPVVSTVTVPTLSTQPSVLTKAPPPVFPGTPTDPPATTVPDVTVPGETTTEAIKDDQVTIPTAPPPPQPSPLQCAATCSVHGDPHYTTFDGLRHHFQGLCSYVLAETCDSVYEPQTTAGLANLKVVARHRACGAQTCLEGIEIEVRWSDAFAQQHLTADIPNPMRIYIGQKFELMLGSGAGASVRPFMPLNLLNGLVSAEIYRDAALGRNLMSLTISSQEIGLQVKWDGRHWLTLCLSANLSGRMCGGLCGNFNNVIADELTFRNGTSLDFVRNDVESSLAPVPDAVAAVQAWGADWQDKTLGLDEAPQPEQCSKTIGPLCQDDAALLSKVQGACGKLRTMARPTCPQMVNVEAFYADCVFDMCNACGGPASGGSEAACLNALNQAQQALIQTCVADSEVRVTTTTNTLPVVTAATTASSGGFSTVTVPIIPTPAFSTVTVPVYSTVTVPVIVTQPSGAGGDNDGGGVRTPEPPIEGQATTTTPCPAGDGLCPCNTTCPDAVQVSGREGANAYVNRVFVQLAEKDASGRPQFHTVTNDASRPELFMYYLDRLRAWAVGEKIGQSETVVMYGYSMVHCPVEVQEHTFWNVWDGEQPYEDPRVTLKAVKPADAAMLDQQAAGRVFIGCAETCSTEYRPVCGSDNNTYYSECDLENARCGNTQLCVTRLGPCPLPPANSPQAAVIGASDEDCPFLSMVGFANLDREDAQQLQSAGLDSAGTAASLDGTWRLEGVRNERPYFRQTLPGGQEDPQGLYLYWSAAQDSWRVAISLDDRMALATVKTDIIEPQDGAADRPTGVPPAGGLWRVWTGQSWSQVPVNTACLDSPPNGDSRRLRGGVKAAVGPAPYEVQRPIFV